MPLSATSVSRTGGKGPEIVNSEEEWRSIVTLAGEFGERWGVYGESEMSVRKDGRCIWWRLFYGENGVAVLKEGVVCGGDRLFYGENGMSVRKDVCGCGGNDLSVMSKKCFLRVFLG